MTFSFQIYFFSSRSSLWFFPIVFNSNIIFICSFIFLTIFIRAVLKFFPPNSLIHFHHLGVCFSYFFLAFFHVCTFILDAGHWFVRAVLEWPLR